jgi:hypothetical protein
MKEEAGPPICKTDEDSFFSFDYHKTTCKVYEEMERRKLFERNGTLLKED